MRICNENEYVCLKSIVPLLHLPILKKQILRTFLQSSANGSIKKNKRDRFLFLHQALYYSGHIIQLFAIQLLEVSNQIF